jgi:hypothetical protein
MKKRDVTPPVKDPEQTGNDYSCYDESHEEKWGMIRGVIPVDPTHRDSSSFSAKPHPVTLT